MIKWWEQRNWYVKTFVIAFITAFILFLPAILVDNGYFLLVGDFNSQQVPFYKIAHDAIRNGEWGWNWYTDIGANFISSYTFYLLGSPFFWLTIPFPNDFVPYLMGPLLMLKFACAALTSFAFLKNHVKNPSYAMLGALLYAFCGYSIYNIFFNHFHDVMVFFPLLLLGMDEKMEHGTRGVLAAAVAINALVNYFFFFGEVVFVVLYYFVRMGNGSFEKSGKKFFGVVIEAVLGLLISGVLMVPSLLTLLQNERINNPLGGADMWMFNKKRLMTILVSYFLPPEFASKQIYIDGAATRWTSLTAYIPLFSMTGVVAYVHSRHEEGSSGRWLRVFLIMLVVMSMVPILNSSFVAFNASYYARWFYMMVMMMILATIKMLDEGRLKEMKKASYIVFIATVVIILIIALTPTYGDEGVETWGLLNQEFWPFFLLLAIVAVVMLLLQQLVLPALGENPKRFVIQSVAIVCAFGILFGNFYVFWGKSLAYSSDNYLIPDAIEGEDKITIPDKDEVVRIDTDNSLSNMGMFWKISCMHAFHSVVPASIVEFYEFIGEERSVNSKPPESQYALRSFLSVHWYFDRIGSSDSFIKKEEPLMPGYTYYDTMAGYDVWENEYYIPMGFTYDHYMTEEDMQDVYASRRVLAMLSAVMLTDEQIGKYQDVLTAYSDKKINSLTEEDYYRVCRERAVQTVGDLAYTKTGFTATSDFKDEELVFFSVPWEEGWRAELNGEPVEIDRVNKSFMAICVPAGENEIEFIYETPGLKVGILATAVGLGGLALYVVLGWIWDKKSLQPLAVVAQDVKETEKESAVETEIEVSDGSEV